MFRRKFLWLYLCDISTLKLKHKYFSYVEECRKTSKADIFIKKDLGRTMANHIYFSENTDLENDGKLRLYRILTAYANFNPKLGYSQGMNVICGTMLIILNPKNDKNSLLSKDHEKIRI